MFHYSANKNLARFIAICCLFFLIGLGLLYFRLLNVKVFIAYVFTSFVGLSLYYYKFTSRPLKLVVKEVAAIIAGNPYKKVNIKQKDEFGLLAHFVNEVTTNVESLSFTLKEGERMADELELASEIQRSVLPKSIPMIPKLDTTAKTRPAEEMGGDSFAICQHNNEYYMYIGDVTGHGAPAGLIMMMVNTLFDVMLPYFHNTKDLAVNINRVLKPRVNQSMFMTTSFFRWDPQTETMYYTGAGHEHLLIYRAQEGVCEAIPAGGIALAMAEDISNIVEEKLIPLKDQDVIVLYSDGITEAVNQTGELFGLERLRQSVKLAGPAGSALRIFESISSDVKNFVGETIQNDDMTLLVMRFTPNGYEPDRPENLVSTAWNEE